MKYVKAVLLAGMLAGAVSATGCAYSGVATTQDGRAVIARNDGLLFGLLRKVYVCQVTPAGLAQCSASESP